jgi:hypothetical protein
VRNRGFFEKANTLGPYALMTNGAAHKSGANAVTEEEKHNKPVAECKITLHFYNFYNQETMPHLMPLAQDLALLTPYRDAHTVNRDIQRAYQGRMDPSSDAAALFDAALFSATKTAAHEGAHCKAWLEWVKPALEDKGQHSLEAWYAANKYAFSEPLADVIGTWAALRSQPTKEALLWVDRLAQGRMEDNRAKLSALPALPKPSFLVHYNYLSAGHATWGFLHALGTESPDRLHNTLASGDFSDWIERGKEMEKLPHEERRALIIQGAEQALSALKTTMAVPFMFNRPMDWREEMDRLAEEIQRLDTSSNITKFDMFDSSKNMTPRQAELEAQYEKAIKNQHEQWKEEQAAIHTLFNEHQKAYDDYRKALGANKEDAITVSDPVDETVPLKTTKGVSRFRGPR